MPRTPSDSHRGASPRPARTYVVLGRNRLFGTESPVRPIGTLRAPDLRTARELAPALAQDRVGDEAVALAVCVLRASACRPAWLWHALVQDGAAARAARPPEPGGP